jgi:hypothetical protein
MARQMDMSPPLDFYFMFTRTDMWEYVLHGRREYDHVVVLQTYVPHNWCAYGPAVACGGPDP